MRIENALQDFHRHKHAILDAGARTGKGNRPIDNWYIPKLEMMQSVSAHIQLNGIPLQWSADITEHAHIKLIKQPARSGNNHKYEEQICRTLDHADKARRFDLAMSIYEMKRQWVDEDADSDAESVVSEADVDEELADVGLLSIIKPIRPLVDYFLEADYLSSTMLNTPGLPPRTWCTDSTAFHLSRDPSFKQMKVDDVATKFNLPDLKASLSHFFRHVDHGESPYTIGGRRQRAVERLPIEKLEVWSRVILQQKDYHRPHIVLPAERLNAHPPNDEWPLGRYDAAFANIDPQHKWPRSGLLGEWFCSIRYA